MHNCHSIDPLVTPFVDGQLAAADAQAVEEHLRVCAPCHSRVAAERAVHDLMHARRATLCRVDAPDALHHRCASFASRNSQLSTHNSQRSTDSALPSTPNPEPRTGTRLVPYAMAASLVIVVGGAFVYQATDKSARVMAAELVADHAKCFALNSALGTFQSASVVEQNMGAAFNWNFHLPKGPGREGLELVGARLCMYGKGKIAHIMYRHQGSPVSVFMLPKTMRTQEFVEVLGHEAAIWCADNRTFVVVAGEPRPNVEQIAAFMQASLH